MVENAEEIVTFKIRAEDRDWAELEQRRIKRESGDKPTQAEIFRLMKDCYVGKAEKDEGEPLWVPPQFQPELEKLVRILRSGDEKAIKAVIANIDLFEERLIPANEDAQK